MMLLYEEDGVFNPGDFGLKVGDIIQIVGIGGGGGGTGGLCGTTTWSTAPGTKSYIYAGGGGGNSGQFKSTYIKLTSLNSLSVNIGQGGKAGTGYKDLVIPELTASSTDSSARNLALYNYLKQHKNSTLGSDGTATYLGDLCIALGGSGGTIGAVREANHGSWQGGLCTFYAASSYPNDGSNGGGGAGGFIPGVEFRGGDGYSHSQEVNPSIPDNSMAGHHGYYSSKGGSSSPTKYGGASARDGSAPGGGKGGTYGSSISGGGGGGGYGAGGGGGSIHVYTSTSNSNYVTSGGDGANGCLLIFF